LLVAHPDQEFLVLLPFHWRAIGYQFRLR
jgi:hypothetical protein